ncbi:MAG: hypothetical protein KIS67_03630 [Verrucomicrobiae bacterium]|nr:hypothetical protein [Verrucomicrobiae bacterium]
MKWQEENLDVLQNLEFAIVEVWRAHSEMTDYSALRAYEAARQHYRAEMRGKPAPPSGLSGLDSLAFEELKKMCEFRLGRDPGPPAAENEADAGFSPIPLDELLACLQELAKSVERHTRSGGRQGYLQFIDGFLK